MSGWVCKSVRGSAECAKIGITLAGYISDCRAVATAHLHPVYFRLRLAGHSLYLPGLATKAGRNPLTCLVATERVRVI